MARSDISNYLIHFTSDESTERAYIRLKKIIKDLRLVARGTKIRGQYRCLCFSEAPLPTLQNGLVNPESYSRYSPFGIMFHKNWIFQNGGRPVIYQTEEEYQSLPESLRWRHMIYEPLRKPPIDFTWEREWRLNRDNLDFSPRDAVIVVLDKHWADKLVSQHEGEEEYTIMQYKLVLDEQIAEMYREPFPWKVVTLRT